MLKARVAKAQETREAAFLAAQVPLAFSLGLHPSQPWQQQPALRWDALPSPAPGHRILEGNCNLRCWLANRL